MNTTNNITAYFSGTLLACLIIVSQTAEAGIAGHAQFVMGNVQVIDMARQMRTLQKGAPVNEGDTIITARGANAQIKMQDGGFVAVRPDTQLKFDSFKFSGKEDGSERAIFSLLKGGFRSVTGLIGRVNKPNYRITTAAATIGIRGTDHETYFVTPQSALAANTPTGTYNKVNVGETFIKTEKGIIFVLPNQMGYAGASNQMPALKPINTNLFAAAEKPRPAEKKSDEKTDGPAKKEEATNEQVRETSSVDETTANVAEPEAKTSYMTTDDSKVEIAQNIKTENDVCLSCPQHDYATLALVAAEVAKKAGLAAIAAETTAIQANTSLAAVAQVNTAPASAAIASANDAVTSTTSLIASAIFLNPAKGLPLTDVSAAQSTADNMLNLATTAQASFATNGGFADSTAITANNLINAPVTGAAALIQNANNVIQTAGGSATTTGSISFYNASLSTAQTAALDAYVGANTQMATANSSLTNATKLNSDIVNAQTSAPNLLAQAQTAALAAQTASLAAQNAASAAAIFHAAGNYKDAAAQLTISWQQQEIALQQQAIAQKATASLASSLATAQAANTGAIGAVDTAVSSATTAANFSTTAINHAFDAQAALANANSTQTNASNQLSVLASNAAVLVLNAPIAAYNNPADATAVWTAGGNGIVEVSPGQYQESIANQSLKAISATSNTSYVLNGSGSLVEMRHANFYQAPTYVSIAPAAVADADIRYSGATAFEAYSTTDHSLYLGRLQGGTMSVTDNAGLVAQQSFNLGLTSVQWMLVNQTSSNFVQSLTGTTSYALLNATSPSDALGNVGTLNSASLTINFGSMTVDTLINLAIAGKVMDISALAVPITGSLASANPETGNGATVTCSGASCAATYLGRVTVLLAGDTASTAGAEYTLWPTAASGSLVSDIIQGGLAFQTNTAPTVSPYASYSPDNILISMTSQNNGSRNYLVDPLDITYTSGSPSSFTQFSFDKLWIETLAVIGGTGPINSTATSGTTGISFGRWTSVTGLEQSSTWQLATNNWMSPGWMYGPQGYLDAGITSPTGQMYGTFNYQLDASTPVFDGRTGLTGTVTAASLSVDFITNLLSTNVGLNVGGEDWLASTSNVPFSGSQFSAFGGTNGNMTISMGVGVTPTPCTTCSGYLNGAFTGQNYGGAMLSYTLSDSNLSNGNSSGISGSIALVRDPAVAITNGTAAPTGFYYVFSWGGNFQLVDTLTTTGGIPTSFSWGSAAAPMFGYYSTTSVTCTTCSVAAPTANSATTGINYGTWDAGTISQTWGNTSVASSPAWISGPEAGPLFLANALVGTKTYTFDGGIVTNANGVAGTVLGTTSLTMDFTRQVIGVNLNLSAPDTSTGATHNWNATTLAGNEAIIRAGQGIGGVEFFTSSYNTTGPGMLTVTVDGTTPGSGNIAGQLTGVGLNGAIMSYQLSAALTTTFEQVSGVAAFAGAASNAATPYRVVMASLTDPGNSALSAIGFYGNSTTRISTDGTGNMTQFDMNAINNTGGNANSSMILNSGTSVLSNAGSDAVTGISWGRWDSGSMNLTDRATGVTTPTTLAGSMHWIAGPTETADVSLPISGTYSYVLAGGTSPTDNLGNTGTLNSATLSANFTAQTVDVGVNVTVAGATMAGTAANVPIIQSTAFYADSMNPLTSTSHLAVTCTGVCGTSAQGVVLGGFTGAGATGAMMTYGFENTGPTNSQVISGTAAFHR